MPRCAIIIPARYRSTRLPGKPLVNISGKPMIQHVYEQAAKVRGVEVVFVATDDVQIFKAVQTFGGRAVMTSPDHPSGTDRLAEAMKHVDTDIIINLQGDEPLIRPADIEILVEGMQSGIEVGTLCHRITAGEALDPNMVKVVRAENGNALYFSRSPIPYERDGGEAAEHFKHIGIYGFRRDVLERYSSLPRPMIERAEQLEQLRLLSAGIAIRVLEVGPADPGVDTPEGLKLIRDIMIQRRPFYELPEAERISMTNAAIDEGRTLIERWAGLKAPEATEWSPRSELAAKLLEGCNTVVDLGCGMMPLRNHLAPNTDYIPVDAIRRNENTIVVDLNKESLPKLNADGWAALGLLEYLFDVAGLLRQLSGTVVTSYNPIDRTDAVRRAHAWVNDYRTEDLEQIFSKCGFTIVSRHDLEGQWVWKLER